MSEPLDRLVSSFYLGLPLPPQKKPKHQTIFSCLAALDKLRKTTDISHLLTASGGKKWSSIEVLTYLVEHGPSQGFQRQACRVAEAAFSSEIFKSAPSPLRRKMLAAYKQAGGRSSTYLKQILIEPFRRIANWGRYRIKGDAQAQEGLCNGAIRFLSRTIEQGVVENNPPEEFFEKLKDLCSKQGVGIRGAKEFYQDLLSELEKHKEEISEWLEVQKNLLIKDFENWAEGDLKVLGLPDTSFAKAPPAIKREWKDRIEYVFMSKAFANAPLQKKQRVFGLYRETGGICSDVLCEVSSTLTLHQSDDDLERCIRVLQDTEVQKECTSIGPEARKAMLERLETLISSHSFTKAKVSERIGLLELYQTMGGVREPYIKQLVFTCIHAETDRDSELCIGQLRKVASESRGAKEKVQQEIENLFSSDQFSTARVQSKITAIEAYQAIEENLDTYLSQILSTLTRAKNGENVDGCVHRLRLYANTTPEADADLQYRLRQAIQSDDLAKASIHSRVALLNLYLERSGDFSTYLTGLISLPPPNGEEEEWASEALSLLQKKEMQQAIARLNQTDQVVLQSGILRLFKTRVFASASSDAKDAVLKIFHVIRGDPATYIWEQACAQSSGPESFALWLQHRDHIITSLRRALDRAIIVHPTVDYVFDQLKGMPSFSQLSPIFTKLIDTQRTLIEEVLEKEVARRPSPMSLLLAIYTPTPEFTVQLDGCLRGPDQKFSELVQQMEDHSLSWTKQFWVAWRALTAQPPILESRIHKILTTFEKEGFSKAPGRFQIEIMNCLSAAAEILDIPQDIKQFIQKHFS